MDSKQCTLRKGASRKLIRTAGSEPSMNPLMVDMGIDPKGDKQIAVKQPRHGHALSSDSIRYTSSFVINRFPADTGKLVVRCLLELGFEAGLFNPRLASSLMALPSEMCSLRARANATA